MQCQCEGRGESEPMSITPNAAPVPDQDSLPLKKRDQRSGSPQQLSDAATFKAPYPYKSHTEFRTKHTGPFQPVPRRVPALYQPWMQTHTPTRSKPHVLSAFREHHGWAEWREFNPLYPGWDFSHHHHNFSGPHREFGPSGIHSGHPQHPPRFRPISLITDGFRTVGGGYYWEPHKTLRDESLITKRQSNGRTKGPYTKRTDRKMEYSPRGKKASPPLSIGICSNLSICLPLSPVEDLTNQHELYKHQTTKPAKHPTPAPLLHSAIEGFPGNNTNDAYISVRGKEGTAVPPALLSSSSTFSPSSSSSPNRFPWLLPHFVAGSLIELRDGRLRRVEDLQTEDFLLGSLARPDLRLSCCTVQSISASSSSSSVSRLLILLHDQQSQELVDVYVEYPFFVRGRGWSSCCPQRTARLCGLPCRQLSVGDVCLALTPVSTPVSAPQPPPPATLEPKTSPTKSDGGRGPLKPPCLQSAFCNQFPPMTDRPSGGKKKEVEMVRRRHCSAPEMRGPGTNCGK